MMHWRRATILELSRSWAGAREYSVLLDPGDGSLPGRIRALAYVEVTGEHAPGDRVLLNVSALLRGLGTGGFALVVAPDGALPADPGNGPDGRGHIVKARYTPQQQMVLAADEQDSPHHATLSTASDLAGAPVVAADLHSALPAIIAGVRLERPQTRIAYVMTDGAALPIAFSQTVSALLDAGWLTSTLTCGQAFGGQLETVSLHSALLAAVHVVGAEVVVVSQGPGNVGTGTPWGFSGVATVEALHAAHVLGGSGVATLRVSGADPRERHRGISHHSLTAYGKALLAPATVPVPVLDGTVGALVRDQAAELARSASARLTLEEIETDGLRDGLNGTPVRLSTMGRGLAEDPAPFFAAAAAGRYAARTVR